MIFSGTYHQDVLGKQPMHKWMELVRRAVNDRPDKNTPSWLNIVRSLYKVPEETVAQHNMDFDAVLDWCRDFHVLTPFDPILEEEAIDALIARLQTSGAEVIDHRTVPFVKCSCSRYMNYAFCVHVAVWYMHHKIIPRTPPSLDLTRIAGPARPGRPVHAVRGGSLSFD